MSSVEQRQLERAQADLERVEQDARDRVRKARAKRDDVILRAVDNGASITGVARAVGMTREGIYAAVRRAREAS